MARIVRSRKLSKRRTMKRFKKAQKRRYTRKINRKTRKNTRRKNTRRKNTRRRKGGDGTLAHLSMKQLREASQIAVQSMAAEELAEEKVTACSAADSAEADTEAASFNADQAETASKTADSQPGLLTLAYKQRVRADKLSKVSKDLRVACDAARAAAITALEKVRARKRVANKHVPEFVDYVPGRDRAADAELTKWRIGQ